MGNLPCFIRLWRSRPSAPQVQAFACCLVLSSVRKDQIRRLVSATCLARRTVPSVSAILRFAASSLLTVSRGDRTTIGFAITGFATGVIVTGVPIGVFTDITRSPSSIHKKNENTGRIIPAKLQTVFELYEFVSSFF
ncbi:hypothetical protein NKI66_21860 [Mesorhizobium sp. M0518]|uniref:hypothetical protein n=1 Tax=unclassified Mesorhizobium TaxID=325217 RepID=UPI003335919E